MKNNFNFDGSKAILYSKSNFAYCIEQPKRKIKSYDVTCKLPNTPDPGCFKGRQVRRG